MATAASSGAEGIWGQLTEPGCISLVTETANAGYKGPWWSGSCTSYIAALKDKAVGTYTQGDTFIPEIAKYAPAGDPGPPEDLRRQHDGRRPGQVHQRLRRRPTAAMFELTVDPRHDPEGPDRRHRRSTPPSPPR